jgi:hypothetical protein
MPLIKKRINPNTVANTDAKPIDSFFETSNVAVPAVNITEMGILGDGVNTMDTPRDKLRPYTNAEIKKKIDELSEHELSEIFRIIKKNNEKYSTNKNGIFINLSSLRKNTIHELNNFILFCDNNNRIFDEEEMERTKYKDIICQ